MDRLPVAAGKLRHRVFIEAPSEDRNSFGQSENEWRVVGQGWADIVPLSGTEAEDARQMHATATTKITLRHRRRLCLTTDHRIRYRGKHYEIGFILNFDELNHTLEFLTSGLKP